MSRWVLALVAVGFALAPVRAADPRSLWEIETFPNAKKLHFVRWVSYSSDGKKLIAQIEEKDDLGGPRFDRLFVWNVASRKEETNLKLGGQAYLGYGMYANATTKVGSALIVGKPSQEVRLADGAKAPPTDLPGRSIGVWFNSENSDVLWLLTDEFDRYELAYGKMPALAADKKIPVREEWRKAKLPGDWSEGGVPVVAVNSDLTRLVVGSRDTRGDRKLTLYNVTADDKLKLTEIAVVPITHKGSITTLRFSPNGKTLVTGAGDSSIALWDVEKAGKDWKPRETISAGNFTVVAFAFSPNGTTLAAGTLDQKGRPNLYLIDVTVGKVLASYRFESAVMALAYSPDGMTLVTGDGRGRIKAWNAQALRNP